MAPIDKTRYGQDESRPLEIVTQWGLVLLAVIAAIGALLRIIEPATGALTGRLDERTLLYLGVAGALLLLKQIKTFSPRGHWVSHNLVANTVTRAAATEGAV